MASLPIPILPGRILCSELLPETAFANPTGERAIPQIECNEEGAILVSSHQSQLEMKFPCTYKEALQSEMEPRSRISSKSMRDGLDSKPPFNTRPLPHFPSVKFHRKKKFQKESGWTKYFDHGGGRVSSLDSTNDEFLIDLSKLFLGLRFAHGAHSQLYHGIYKDVPVAVKIIRLPDDDETESLEPKLVNQFNREVALLTRLRHPNVIEVKSRTTGRLV